MAGIVSDRKYEKEGGPGIAACAALIRRHSVQSALDLRHFVRWIFFNLYSGNNDSHAKNLSLLQLPARGLVLSPCYDLMCTRLYPGLSREFAFAIGGEVRPGSVGREQVIVMAKSLGMQPRFVLGLAADLAQRLPLALDLAIETVAPTLPASAAALAHRLRSFIKTTTKKTAARLAE